jgi:hypothetical protein
MTPMRRVYSPLSAAIAVCLFLPAHVRAVTFTEQGATVLGGANPSGRSVSLADIDNDGDLDAFFQGAGTTVLTSARQIFINNLVSPTGTNPLTFTNDTANWFTGLGGLGVSWSSAWADYNGDGRVDVFVGQENGSANFGDLLRNTGDELYNESENNGVIPDPGFHQNVGWADIDNDRDLDLIIGQEGPEPHEIYLQGPAGSFTAYGEEAGIQVAFGTKAYGTAIGDSDGDGDLDIYISTCRSGGNIRNNFFKNMLVETGTLEFVDIADTNGTQYMPNSYGSEFIDFDNDGDLDLHMTGADGQKTKIFRNNGGNMFTDVDTINGHELLRTEAGVPVRGVDLNGSKAIDYDNDGDLDLYFHDNLAQPNHRLFRNDGNWKFYEATAAEGLSVTGDGTPVGAGAYDSAWGDLDRDGDQDLILPNNAVAAGIPTPERVYISNASTSPNHWLYVQLEGPNYNTTGIGASLFATVNDGTLQEVTLRREANTNIGTFNQSDLPVHFGLGAAAVIDELRIQWPDGTTHIYYDVPTNQYLTLQFLPGDFDRSGTVDAGDYVVWRKGLGPNDADWDYNVWRGHFGQNTLGGGNSAGATAPEPTSVGLLLISTAFLVMRRRTS